MSSIVLFGVGSPLVHEYEESCLRLGWTIVLGVQNVDVEPACSDLFPVRTPNLVTKDELTLAYVAPLFTPCNREFAVTEAAKIGFLKPATVVDPTAIVASNSQIGPGSFVNAGTVIGAACSFGKHIIINRNCSIGHHNTFDDFASVGPGSTTCGNVTVGRGAMIGAGAVILPGVTIGANAIIGAGSVIVKDVPTNTKIIMKRNMVVTPVAASND